MCGIVGAFSLDGRRIDEQLVLRMRDLIAARGPDDAGIRTFSTDNESPDLVLAHRRLSILDLSAAGHQPMETEDGNVCIVFNGEIYNHQELRGELEAAGHTFRSKSDTETLLRGWIEWGEALVPRLNGMFAFAIADLRHEPTLFLARDRFGQKPLYLTAVAGTFWFASEMKALLEIPGLHKDLSAKALERYLTFLWVPEPDTILADVTKLPAGCTLTITAKARRQNRYHTSRHVPDERFTGDTAVDALRDAVRAAVKRTTLSDVPVGAFLSGGLDSSAIVATMAEAGQVPHHVYTVAFGDSDAAHEGFPDDLRYAREVAQAIGAPQTETMLTPDMAQQLPRLVWHLDEPLADPAILPLYAMCQAAKGETKVLLSGMGADELFGGYRRHAVAAAAARWQRMPSLLRSHVIHPLVELLPSAGTGRLRPTFRRVKRFTRALDHPASTAVGFASWSTEEERRNIAGPKWRDLPAAGALDEVHDPKATDLLNQLLQFDTNVYLPSHNLNYTDKISMATSVEVRAPFLDNELSEIALGLPADMKVRSGRTKYALKEAMRGILPDSVIDRGKTGLGAPIRSWFVGPLKPLLDDTLSADHLSRHGLFDAEAVMALRHDLEAGREDTSHLLWAILTLTLWLDAFDIPGDIR